jgi:hypothetical protein
MSGILSVSILSKQPHDTGASGDNTGQSGSLQSLKSLKSLQSSESLQSLQSLQSQRHANNVAASLLYAQENNANAALQDAIDAANAAKTALDATAKEVQGDIVKGMDASACEQQEQREINYVENMILKYSKAPDIRGRYNRFSDGYNNVKSNKLLLSIYIIMCGGAFIVLISGLVKFGYGEWGKLIFIVFMITLIKRMARSYDLI